MVNFRVRIPLYLVFSVLATHVPAAPTSPTPASVRQAKTAPAPGVKPNPAAPNAKPAVPAKPKPAYELYSYYGDRYRDPFIALTGAIQNQGADRPPQIQSLQLRGIMHDARGRIALLTSGVSSYILRGGRLYDGRNHVMKGISGVIKTESVVLMGSDRTVKELKVTNQNAAVTN
jgi:hypothetical protein